MHFYSLDSLENSSEVSISLLYSNAMRKFVMTCVSRVHNLYEGMNFREYGSVSFKFATEPAPSGTISQFTLPYRSTIRKKKVKSNPRLFSITTAESEEKVDNGFMVKKWSADAGTNNNYV